MYRSSRHYKSSFDADQTIARIIEPSILEDSDDTWNSWSLPSVERTDSMELDEALLLKKEMNHVKSDKRRWEKNLRDAVNITTDKPFWDSDTSSDATIEVDMSSLSFVRAVQHTLKKELQADALLAATLSGNKEEQELHSTRRGKSPVASRKKSSKSSLQDAYPATPILKPGHHGHVSNQLQLLGFPVLPENTPPQMLEFIGQLVSEINRRGDVIETLLQTPAQASIPCGTCSQPQEPTPQESRLHAQIAELQQRLDATLRDFAGVQRGGVDVQTLDYAEGKLKLKDLALANLMIDHQLVLDVCHLLNVEPENRKRGLLTALVPLLPGLRQPLDEGILPQIKSMFNLPIESNTPQIISALDNIAHRLQDLELGLDEIRQALFSSPDRSPSVDQVLKRAAKVCRAWKNKRDSTKSQVPSLESTDFIDVVGLSPGQMQREKLEKYEQDKKEMLRKVIMDLDADDISSVPAVESFGMTSDNMDTYSDMDKSVALKRLEQLLAGGGDNVDIQAMMDVFAGMSDVSSM